MQWYDRTIMAMTYTGVNFDTKDGIDIYIMYVSDTEKETALSFSTRFKTK